MAKVKKFDMKGKGMKQMTAVPAGDYLAEVVKSETKKTKSGDGSYLSLEWSILKGEYKGRRFWSTLNLDNPSREAQEIAEGEFAQIHIAMGLDTIVKDSEKLHKIPCLVTLKVREDDKYGPKNIPTFYESAKKKKDKEKSGSEDGKAPWDEKGGKKDKKGGKKDKKKKKQ